MSRMLRNRVQRKFKMRGYTLRVEALTEILSFVERFPEAAVDDAVDLLLDELRQLSLKSSILDREAVSQVVSSLLEADAAAEENPSSTSNGFGGSALRIINAFDVPKFRYDLVKKTFYEYTGRLPLHGDASAKGTLYRDRFLLLFQRLSRQPEFCRPAFDSHFSEYGTCEISPIQSLVGQIGKRWIMGLISQLEDGHFYLEDLSANVKFDFSDAISFKINYRFILESSSWLYRSCSIPHVIYDFFLDFHNHQFFRRYI